MFFEWPPKGSLPQIMSYGCSDLFMVEIQGFFHGRISRILVRFSHTYYDMGAPNTNQAIKKIGSNYERKEGKEIEVFLIHCNS